MLPEKMRLGDNMRLLYMIDLNQIISLPLRMRLAHKKRQSQDFYGILGSRILGTFAQK